MTRTITSIDTALRIYYEKIEIENKDIVELFGKMSNDTVLKLKRMVKDEMMERSVRTFGTYTVNTKVAYEVWGIDVDDLEKRRAKLMKLGLRSAETAV